MTVGPKAAEEVVALAVTRSFDALQSMEMMQPNDAGVSAANMAFERALQAEALRKERRPQKRRGADAAATASEG